MLVYVIRYQIVTLEKPAIVKVCWRNDFGNASKFGSEFQTSAFAR